MKLFTLGATGRTGQEVVKQATELGYDIVAYVRSPEKMNIQKYVEIVQGELNDDEKMEQAMTSCNAVLVTLGNPVKDSSADLFGSLMPRLVKIMGKAKVKRIVSLSSMGTGETILNVSYPYKIGVKTFLKGNQADHEKGEKDRKSVV